MRPERIWVCDWNWYIARFGLQNEWHRRNVGRVLFRHQNWVFIQCHRTFAKQIEMSCAMNFWYFDTNKIKSNYYTHKTYWLMCKQLRTENQLMHFYSVQRILGAMGFHLVWIWWHLLLHASLRQIYRQVRIQHNIRHAIWIIAPLSNNQTNASYGEKLPFYFHKI